jgi:hypothetical protein
MPDYRADQILLEEIKLRLAELSELQTEMSDHWGYEDLIYRFYHGSFKVYRIQQRTTSMVEKFKELKAAINSRIPAQQAPAPDAEEWAHHRWKLHSQLNDAFLRIVSAGTGIKFDLEHNKDWDKHTRPQVEAFFHAKFFLDQIVKYGKSMDSAPDSLPSGWAAVLYLFNIR